MKFSKTHLFILVSSVALAIVLGIQLTWIIRTAKIKEEIFNDRAKLVLQRTAEAIHADTSSTLNAGIQIREKEVHKIDSLFSHYLKQYNFKIDYSFELIPVCAPAPADPALASFQAMQQMENVSQKTKQSEKAGCYQTCLPDNSGQNSMELKLVFPDKAQYIRAEMGLPFISSILLIILVLIMSWRTILSLLKEKKISEHTTDFLNNMTHEFKTPLTNIALAGKMMTKDVNIQQQGKIKHYSGIILEENEKLRLQVEQVLSMTALERGEIPLQKADIDMHQLIHDSMKCISVQIEELKGEINLELNANKFIVFGDKTHLTNAICNLIDNGVKYARDRPELKIITVNSDDQLIILFSDNGIGIEKEYHKKVFDKFFRVPTGDVHDVKGFGLGLAYIKHIIELHGGSINLQSEKGSGTTFTITLPHV